MEKYYKVKTNKAYYNVIIDNDNIYVGGKTYYCLAIHQELNLIKHMDCYYNKLPNVESVEANDMMYALLYILKEKYSNKDICKIVFEDESNNDCGNLASYYLAFKEKTWYEKNFNAKLKDDILMKDYIQHKKIFTNKSLSNNDFERDIFQYKDISPEYKKIIIDIYKVSISNKDFLNKIYKYIKENNVNCLTFLRPWLDSFIKIRLKFAFINGQKWIINCNDFNMNTSRFSFQEINKHNSLPKFNKKVYTSIKKREHYLKEIYNGKKFLKNNEKEKFKDRNWVGWSDIINTEDYNNEDKEYLDDLLNKFELNFQD